MQGLPLVSRTHKFTANGTADVVADIGLNLPLHRIPNKWSLQVTGYDANGNVVSASAWKVTVQRSLDGKGYDDDNGAMLTHVNGTNANGAVVSTDGNLRPARYVRFNCTTLNLGSAAYILATLLGER